MAATRAARACRSASVSFRRMLRVRVPGARSGTDAMRRRREPAGSAFGLARKDRSVGCALRHLRFAGAVPADQPQAPRLTVCAGRDQPSATCCISLRRQPRRSDRIPRPAFHLLRTRRPRQPERRGRLRCWCHPSRPFLLWALVAPGRRPGLAPLERPGCPEHLEARQDPALRDRPSVPGPSRSLPGQWRVRPRLLEESSCEPPYATSFDRC
jgi:hypothetical protein